MFSLQTVFGKGDRFYVLLEASADAAERAVKALTAIIREQARQPALDGFIEARGQQKQIAEQIDRELVERFVTGLDREDIEALASVLYKLPKTCEKFAERFGLVREFLGDTDFSKQADLLDRASVLACAMVKSLRSGMQIDLQRKRLDQIKAIETEADGLLLDVYRAIVEGDADAKRVILLKDLYDLLEKAVDRCRDIGNAVFHVVLKNS